MGLTYFKRYRMELDLRGRRFDTVGLPPGYRLVPFSASQIADHAEAKYHSFRDEIDSAIFSCFSDLDACRRLMEEISQKDGFLPEATWLVEYCGQDQCHQPSRHRGWTDLLDDEPHDWHRPRWVPRPRGRNGNRMQGREWCGTIQGIRTPGRCGGIQNVGITPLHRGRGVGTGLIAATLAGFQQVGLQRAYLEVTVRNLSAVRLYNRMGFQRTKTLYKAVELAYSPASR